MNRTMIASLACLVSVLGATFAYARPAHNVHAVSEYANPEGSDGRTAPEEQGAFASVMTPGTTRSVRHVTIAKGTARMWVCGDMTASSVGGSYRTCEWH